MPHSSNNTEKPIRVCDFITYAVRRLKTSGIESADLDARILIGHVLKLDRVQLISQNDRVLDAHELRLMTVFIKCRARHESVARILREREFWSLPFGLNEATLEPRPDSETLIEFALKEISQRDATSRILDIGTGTGCLLLSLLHELSNATGLGLDISVRAVEQAQENAHKLNLSNRAIFKVNDWLADMRETFDVIISNPPYIASDIIPTLSSEVRDYDPKLALEGGVDGLDPYRHLIPLLPFFLKPKGFAVFEIGYDQSAPVSALFTVAGFTKLAVHKDLGSNDRCILARID